MRRILIINTVGYVVGGMSTVIMNYYKNMPAEIRCDFVVNEILEERYRREMEQGGGEIFLLNRNKNPFSYFGKVMRILRERQYDAVHVHGNSCTMAVELFAAGMAGCRKRIAHSHSTTCERKILHKILRPLFERCCTERLACGREAGRWLFGKKYFTVLPNALDLDRYVFDENKRRKIRRELKISEEEFVIGHVGFFNRLKNQEFALYILQELLNVQNRFRLVLVGEGGLKERVRNKAAQMGISEKVIFYGETADVPGVMSAFDTFVFPSLYEGIGIAAVEAQLMSLPCVLSEGVPEEAVISRSCVKVSLDASPEKWRDAVLRFAGEENPRDGSALDRKKTEGFDIKKQALKLGKIYGLK